MIDRRSEPRARTRLRPGKLLSTEGAHLADCAILDLSASGARVRQLGSAPLPEAVVLFEEADGRRWPARRVWGAGAQAGFSLRGPAETLGDAERRRIAGPFYAVS